jgi:hypothetical protein
MDLGNPKQNIKHKRFILYPQDNFKTFWDIYISLILLISCFTAPIDIAFPDIETPSYLIFANCIDYMFMIDICINFLSAYENDQFKIVDDKKEICCNYLKGWFSIDILAIMPFELIL